MADKSTVEKVKSLLEGHCYGPLKEAAEKWLAVADEKYGDKFDSAVDKLGDFADKYSEASISFGEKMSAVSDKLGEKYDQLSEKAAPAIDAIKEKAAPAIDVIKDKVDDKYGDKLDELKDKANDASEKILENELIKQLKEGICTVGDLMDTFGSKDAVDKFGEEVVETMKKHAAELKEKGEEFCDCEACRKARSILKDFGEDIEKAFDKKEDAPEEEKAE